MMTNRKVFARFYTDTTTGITYRLNTILQFGNSWKIIGSAILLNPGSATSSELPCEEDLSQLNILTGEKDGWKIVNSDPTIRSWLPKVFNGYFANKYRELNGVILLFNLFNIKEANSSKAQEIFMHANSEYLYTSKSDIDLINKSPIVFIGWGRLSPELTFHAKHLFSQLDKKIISHYNTDFEKNIFYHPRALQLGYKRWKNAKKNISKFENALGSMK